MAQNKAWEKAVRHALIDREWSMTRLSAEVKERTGLNCDSGYLNKIFHGQRNPEKVVNAVNEILDINLDDTANEGVANV